MSGELFLWNRDKDLLKTAAAVPEVVHLITDTQGMHSTGTYTSIHLILQLPAGLTLNLQ